MKKIILVGAGDYYKKILAPSLKLMQKEGLCEFYATVGKETKDVQKPEVFSGVEHITRAGNQKLSFLLSDFVHQETIVILSHVNRLHAPDAKDLLENNFKVMVEKPYCIDKSQLKVMKNLIKKYPNKIVLSEYYLMMKSIPLLILAGKVKKNSFYFRKRGLLNFYKKGLEGRIKEFIGRPKFVLTEVLEGEGETGRLDHRGPHLSDLREGGGMIQDLGIHAIAPLFALEDFLGKIDINFSRGKVRIAKNREYVKMAIRKFKIPPRYIGESYAEIDFLTSKGIPIKMRVGKYTPQNRNQRQIIIKGERGRVFLDLSSCSLFLESKILEIPKLANSKYYSVLRAALEVLGGKNPFNFEPNDVDLNAQLFILNVLQKAYPKLLSN